MILIGGVSQLYLGDMDVGRHAAERLATEPLGPEVAVEDLYFGAVAVAQQLEDVSPELLVLVGAAQRGRLPGTVERRRITDLDLTPEEQRGAVHDAGTGYVTLELVVEVAWSLGVLPHRTVVIEVEPARTQPSEELTPAAARGLEEALTLVRSEIRRHPVHQLADRLRQLPSHDRSGPGPAVQAMHDLLAELQTVDREGRWAGAFSARDQLRTLIAEDTSGPPVSDVHSNLWWELMEALDRIEVTSDR